MVKVIEGDLTAKGGKFCVLASRFNDFIAKGLVSGCLDMLERHGVEQDDITLVRVPGAFEIPAAARKLAKNGSYDAVICLGAVIRGATPHFEYVSSEVAKGVAQASFEAGIPVVFGVITADTIEQAIERAGTKDGNKGADAALCAIEMVNLYKQV